MRTVALYEMLFGILTIVAGIIGSSEPEGTLFVSIGVVLGTILLFGGLSMQKGSKNARVIVLGATVVVLAAAVQQYYFGTAGFIPTGLLSILAIISLLLLVILYLQPAERKRIF